MATLKNMSNATYLAVFVIMISFGVALEFVSRYLWMNHRMPSLVQELISSALGWTAIIGIFALVPISAFRPRNRFSLGGDCKQRARIFALTASTAIGLVLLYAIAIASAI